MNDETLTAAAAVLLSLLFAYTPGLARWYEHLGEGEPDDMGTKKRLVMLAALVAVSLGSFGLACTEWGAGLGIPVACNQEGAAGLVRALILAVMANQTTYLIAPHPNRNGIG
jgi:hypothetical protein